MLKTKKFRRLLAGLLAVLMLSVCLPVGAFAAPGDINEGKMEINVFYETEDGAQVANGKTFVDLDFVDDQEKGKGVVSTGALTDVPDGYEVVNPQDVFFDNFLVRVTVRETEKTISVNYWDVENNVQAGEGKVVVDANANNVNTSALKDIPEGYELSRTGDVTINDGWIFVEVKPIKPATKTVGVNYWDVENNVQAGEGKVVVDANANNVNTSALKDIPEGYEMSRTGDVAINDGWIFVEVCPIATTKTVGVNYFDIVNDVQVFESSVVVDADANNVNYTALTDIPEGYELVNVGDFQINDGWIFVAVRPVETTVTVGVNYWDIVNNKQVYEGKVTVDKDAYNVNTSNLTDVPDGYELVNVGDVQINDGWIFVEIKPIETTVTVGVNYWDVVNNKQVYEGKVTVDKDAYNVNTSDLTDIPEGYELVNVGDVQINDGWIFVEVRPVATTKVIGVNYWDVVNNEQVAEGEAIVAADAWNVNSSALVDIPEGYELVNVGDFQINDGWIYVEVKPVPTTKTVGLNYWDIINNKQVAEGSVEVAADATNVNTSTFTDIPEGYELVWTGDLQINDGWVWVEVRPTKTLRIFWAIDNGEQADFADGSEDMYTQELTWKHINDDITMPELAIADGYKLAGWSVSGQESEYWDASLETTNVGGRYVEDENGGIISITANIVAVTEEPTEPSDPSTGDNTTTVTGKDEHPDIAEAKANGTWGAPTATPAAASTIPQNGHSMPVVMLIVIALVAAGAVGGLVVLRKRSHQ